MGKRQRMLKMIVNTGHAMRMITAFASAVFTGLCAWQLQDMSGSGAGQATVVGVWALAAASALGGLLSLRRLLQTGKPKSRATGLPDLPGDPGFDPDAIIARHLAQRATAPLPEPDAPLADRPETLPPRPVFGRKGL